jgi:hypothetical protein
MLVLALAPLLRLASHASWSVPAHRLASVAVLTAGLAWFAGRTLPWVG